VRSKLPLIGGAAALLAGVGIIAAIWSNGTTHSAACPPVHAPVPAAAQKALAAYTGRIEHDIEHSGDGTRDEWWDDAITGQRRQIAWDRNGRVESEFVTMTSGGVQRSAWVLYPARTVTITNERFPTVLQRNGSQTAANIAQINRDMVANGRATIVGREEIDGRQTLHLRQTIHPAVPPAPAGMPLPKGFHIPRMPAFKVDTWVDPLTYLTVRTRVGEPSGASFRDESWLLRTPANIAKTKLVIPPGFKHVVPQQGHFDYATGFITIRCRQS
jgi:hypothetical protein